MVASYVALRYEAFKAFRTDESYAVSIARMAVIIDRKRTGRQSRARLVSDRPRAIREHTS